MRRTATVTTAAAALLAGAFVVGAGGAAQAAGESLSMGLHFDRYAPADYPGMCQYVVTMTAGTPDKVRNYVYEESSSPIVLGGKKKDELTDGVVATGDQVAFLLPKGSTFAFAAYGEYSTGKRTVVSVNIPETVSCA